MKKIFFISVFLIFVQMSNALTVRLSLDGVNPAPLEVDSVAGQLLKLYVISDSGGIGYWERIWESSPKKYA